MSDLSRYEFSIIEDVVMNMPHGLTWVVDKGEDEFALEANGKSMSFSTKDIEFFNYVRNFSRLDRESLLKLTKFYESKLKYDQELKSI